MKIMTKLQRHAHNAYHRVYRRTKYYPANRAACIAYAMAYHKRNPEKFKKYVRRYQTKNALAFSLYYTLRNLMIKDGHL